MPLDVTDAGAIRTAHAAVRARTASLDLLINNAGIYAAGGSEDPSERLGTLVAGLVRVLDALTAKHNGRFLT